MTEVRCSDAARARCDVALGTAPPAMRWLLVEQDGGWLPDTRASVQAPEAALALLDAALAQAKARLQLIRRPGRDADAEEAPSGHLGRGASFEHALAAGAPTEDRDDRQRRWCVIDARLGVEVWGVRDADGGWGGGLEALADPLAAGAVRAAGVLLVCCHGRHDACCALRGRPVAGVLAKQWPAETWETSHLGGDRFAANLAVLPDGVLYGYVSAESAVTLVRDHQAGRPDAAHVRGIVGRDPDEQAALLAAAPLLDEKPWDRRLTTARVAPGPAWRVVVRMGERRVEVRGHDRLTEPARLTCGASSPRSALVPVVDAARLV